MPANKFKFHLLTGSNPQAQYDAITTKDPYTFYLTADGIGYLGTVPLFGGGANRFVFLDTAGTYQTYETGKMYLVTASGVNINTPAVLADKGMYIATSASTLASFDDDVFMANMVNYIANNAIHSTDASLDKDYEGADTTVMTSKAVTTFVHAVLDDISILQTAFFRKVELHTLTAADMSNVKISKLPTDKVGDTGLLFTRDNDPTDDSATDDDEEFFFINLNGFITIYTGTTSNTVEVTVDPSTFEITCNVVIATGENSIQVDTTNGGLKLNKTSTIDTTTPSSDKLVTEASLVAYITAMFEDVVTYTISGGGEPVVDDGDE